MLKLTSERLKSFFSVIYNIFNSIFKKFKIS
uniref:Uncharacterized protein n=1 Tax=Myoviridae sp. ctjhW4 TaxID=2825162 RepID=A0A8S5PT67_9CAUD|nr:MAG TPA: hypothetical protein [Myoviridae sp. ctjhW4]